MPVEEEMVQMIVTAPGKCLAPATDILIQLLRLLNDTNATKAVGKAASGAAHMAQKAGKAAYGAATRGLDGVGTAGCVSMRTLEKTAERRGEHTQFVSIGDGWVAGVAEKHNLEGDEAWELVKSRLKDAGVAMHVVRTNEGVLGVDVCSSQAATVGACMDQLQGALDRALEEVGATEDEKRAAHGDPVREDTSAPYPDTFSYNGIDFSRDKVASHELGCDCWRGEYDAGGDRFEALVWVGQDGLGCYRVSDPASGVLAEEAHIGRAGENPVEEAAVQARMRAASCGAERSLGHKRAQEMEQEASDVKKFVARRSDAATKPDGPSATGPAPKVERGGSARDIDRKAAIARELSVASARRAKGPRRDVPAKAPAAPKAGGR